MKNRIAEAVRILKSGGVVAFPTETVYGLGARLSSAEGIKNIFKVKGRPSDNPLIVHISGMEQFRMLTHSVPPQALDLARRFWPGPLTLVCKRTEFVPTDVTAGLDTVALRMPAHPTAQRLIRALGEPVAAPSANRSGRPSATRHEDVQSELGSRADLILDGGNAPIGLESTVVDVTHTPFEVLRPGWISIEDLKKICPRIKGPARSREAGAARSPGLKHKHYQPACKVVLVPPQKWRSALSHWARNGARVGVICAQGRVIPEGISFKKVFREKEDLAKSLYSGFFDAEKSKVDVLLVESVAKEGLGLAIMDRLSRASR